MSIEGRGTVVIPPSIAIRVEVGEGLNIQIVLPILSLAEIL